MKKLLLALLLVLCLALLADVYLLDRLFLRAGWDGLMNEPNYACNFDDECERKDIESGTWSSMTFSGCSLTRCVAKSWNYRPAPWTTPAPPNACAPELYGESPECECVSYRCQAKRKTSSDAASG